MVPTRSGSGWGLMPQSKGNDRWACEGVMLLEWLVPWAVVGLQREMGDYSYLARPIEQRLIES